MTTRTAALTIAVLVGFAFVATVASAAAVPTGCSGTGPNTLPINTAAPVLRAKVANGKRYEANAHSPDNFTVLHLFGTTDYDNGVAQGTLMKDEINAVIPMFEAYIKSIINGATKHDLPAWLVTLLADKGIWAALDILADLTRAMTPSRYTDEMKGIADGANINVNYIHGFNLFPSLIKAGCTITLAHKSATATGTIAHLRALDIDDKIPIKNFPAVTVYHFPGSSKTPQHKLCNFGWVGMIGSLTGFNERGLGVGEKVWLGEGRTDGSYWGEPWMFTVSDALRFHDTIDGVVDYFKRANNSWGVHLGWSDQSQNKMAIMNVDKKLLQVQSTPLNYTGHPAIADTLYMNMHKQPSANPCMGTLLGPQAQGGYHGKISAENLATDISPIEGSGNMHLATFDSAKQVAYFANARKTYVTSGHEQAFKRQLTRIDMMKLFAEEM